MSGFCVFLSVAMASVTLTDDRVALELVSTGASSTIGWYSPKQVVLALTKPDTIKKLPSDLIAPSFGVIEIAGAVGATFHVLIDEPEGKPARLFVDTNGNGDLTDDPATEWIGKKNDQAEGALTFYDGGATLSLGEKDSPFDVHLGMYRFDPRDEKRAGLKNMLLYFRDYARIGQIKIGESSYSATLSDEEATGDFRGSSDAKNSGVFLLVDVNGNGEIDSRGERFDVRKPFNLGGTTWEFADMTKTGEFRLAKSSATVNEVKPPPDHRVGNVITAFTADRLDGARVSFPSDYKGQIVLLDFWATWCGPCMKEMPAVIAAYEKFHSKGFDVLGISLDQKDSAEKVKQVTSDKKMTWPQVYDGGFWKAQVAELYGINSIPATYLVDGDTGKVIGTNLRGEALEAAVEKALNEKGK